MASKGKQNSSEHQKLWVNFVISGEPAEVFRQLKERGIVHSTRDAFTQGIMCLQERIVRSDLKKAQLEATKSLKERGYHG